MSLSDVDIRREMKAGRIVFSPKLASDQISPGSVDLTLGKPFWVFKKKYLVSRQPVDLSKIPFTEALEKKNASSITLPPGGICMGITKEKITLAPDLAGRLEGRSRYARMGLAVHVTSAMVQPGSDNHQVLEIVNLAPFPIKLSTGMRISQIVFEYTSTPTSRPYAKVGKVAAKQ